ncbi:hypothetical protein ACOSP7_010350 [Xanthoceras sorbifolium]|uniref:HVA22-like protein n=1 Tax=Xanthoceras sorbifolium TaxID=99658 RepID=A0ABQ8HTI4_9ROSI|nr:hypothetical protein JRO89_XS07G0108600 [Xanthoceras sorbifolium]
MGWGGFIWVFANLLSVLSRPSFTMVYPLYASVRAIESNSYSRNQQCLTCWVLFALILCLEMVFAEFLKCVPTWPYVKAVAIILLLLPFHGASYFYKHFIRAYVVDKLQMGNILFIPRKQGVVACIPDAADMSNLKNGQKELEKHIICQETLETRADYTGMDHIWPSSAKTVQEWSCALCQVNTSSNKCLEEHLQGKKHKIREQELKAYALETTTRQKYSSMSNKHNNGMILPGRLNRIAKVNLAKWHGFVRSMMWCRWKKPEFGCTKLNTDGSVDRQNAGFGGLFRDYRGEPICAFVSKAHCEDTFLVELWAVWRGLVLASRLGIKVIWVESDSQSVVKTINKKQPYSAKAGSCLKNIWGLLRSFETFRVSHSWRETNRAADYLSKMVLTGSDVVFWPTDFPDSLSNIIKDDAEGRLYSRR